MPQHNNKLMTASDVTSGTETQSDTDGGAYRGAFTAADLDAGGAGSPATHNVLIGYVLWIFGFLGSHRFYYGKPISGTLYFFTLGLLFIGWIVDLFLIPGMARQQNRNWVRGPNDYSVAWLLLTFAGVFGVHRFYLGKIFTGVLYLFTFGLFLIGIIYDFWTLNEQISESNQSGP